MIKNIATFILSFFLVVGLYFGLLLYDKQESLLFKNVPLDQDYVFEAKNPVKEVYLDTSDGGKIHALLYQKKQQRSKYLVLYFHGRGGNLSTKANAVTGLFLDKNYDVLMMDYRGFGKSYGPLSEKKLLSDTDLIYSYAASNYDPSHMIIYGRSLGTGFAAFTASNHKAKLLILEAPYYSMIDLASEKFSFLPKSFFKILLKYHLKTSEWILKSQMPVEIFHGTHDKLIPIENSKKLRALQQDKIHLTILKEATHDDLASHKEYLKTMEGLLKK